MSTSMKQLLSITTLFVVTMLLPSYATTSESAKASQASLSPGAVPELAKSLRPPADTTKAKQLPVSEFKRAYSGAPVDAAQGRVVAAGLLCVLVLCTLFADLVSRNQLSLIST